MDREKLLQKPLPIDRVAARVVRAAKPEHLWRPMPKDVRTAPPVDAILRVARTPLEAVRAKPELLTLPGRRRDRMVILGYAAEQGSKNQKARWVVRCDCGNYEHRTQIFRWIGTDAPDMCRECRNRAHKLRGGAWVASGIPAQRKTKTVGIAP
jgi:hypothetical protein